MRRRRQQMAHVRHHGTNLAKAMYAQKRQPRRVHLGQQRTVDAVALHRRSHGQELVAESCVEGARKLLRRPAKRGGKHRRRRRRRRLHRLRPQDAWRRAAILPERGDPSGIGGAWALQALAARTNDDAWRNRARRHWKLGVVGPTRMVWVVHRRHTHLNWLRWQLWPEEGCGFWPR